MKKRIRLSEGQLCNVIKESILNELDWKTYDNAKDKIFNASQKITGVVSKFLRDIKDIKHPEDLSDPDVRWALTNYLSKKYGRKYIKPLVNSLSDKQLFNLVREMDVRDNDNGVLRMLSDLWGEMSQARNKNFADKYGFEENPSEINTMTDKKGNEWDITYPGSIYDKDDNSTRIINKMGKNGKLSKTGRWSKPRSKDEKANERLRKVTQSNAAKDLLNKYNGKSQYTPGKGWNESIIRRITENVICKLNEGEYEKNNENIKHYKQALIGCGLLIEHENYNGYGEIGNITDVEQIHSTDEYDGKFSIRNNNWNGIILSSEQIEELVNTGYVDNKGFTITLYHNPLERSQFIRVLQFFYRE